MDFLARHVISAAKTSNSPMGYSGGGNSMPYQGYGYDGSKWQDGLSGNGDTPEYNNSALRANGRGAYADSTIAATIAKRAADMTVDVGLKFFSSPDFKTLGITKERAKEIGDKITRTIHAYSLSKGQERAGTMNLYQAQRLYQVCNVRDGEEFIRLYYSKDRSLLSSVQFSFIEPNQIRSDTMSGGYLPYGYYDGINRNSKGQEISYDIWTIKPNGTIKAETIPRVGEKSKRTFMLHCFAPEFPGQKRGLSKLGSSAQDFQNIEDFIQSHTQKAINESNIFMYNENQLQTPSNPGRDQSLPGSAGVVIPSSKVTPIGETTSDPTLVCNRPTMPVMKPGSLMFFNLTQGDKLKPFPNTTPSDGFDMFIDAYASYLSAKIGMPKSILKMEFGQSYSASRGELLLYWKTVNVERNEMVSDFNNPLMEMILSEEIAAGRLSLLGWGDARMRMAWMNGVWYGSSIPSIDPKKEADANKLNLTMNVTTLDKVTRNHDGGNAEMNILENQKVFPEMAQPYFADGGSAVVEEEPEEKNG